MKKALIWGFAFMFLFGVSLALAGDNCPAAKSDAACCAKGKTQAAASVAQKTETKAEDPHAGCAMHEKATTASATNEAEIKATTTAEAPAAAIETKDAVVEKVPEGTCPEVAEHSAINTFHEQMHPMHMALEESKYAEIREMYPKLQESSKGLAEYKCPMSDKCSPECKAKFEAKKAELIKSIDELGTACKGEDNTKIDATFGTMHEAYIAFASMCAPAAPAKTEAAKIEETKAEETK